MSAQPRTYGFSKDEARRDGEGNRIEHTGKYTGIFTKAKRVIAGTGSEGVEFDFKSGANQTASRMQVWTYNKAGEPISMGQQRISAILCCVGVSSMASTAVSIKEYNWESRAEELVTVDMFNDLLNKPVGLVLQRELYTKTNGASAGQDGERIQMLFPFHAETGRTAKEMIDGTPAEQIDKIMETLGDSDKRSNQSAPQQSGGHAPQQTGVAPAGFGDDFGDSIPF